MAFDVSWMICSKCGKKPPEVTSFHCKDPVVCCVCEPPPADSAPRVALEILKDVFLGNGKPIPPAEALQCLEAFLPRIEADPINWWNRPEDHESDKR